ncbi:MAG: N-acetylglucosaminyl-diphospho-decaprenol L-rhamnosyltransferase [Glaciihabitans sp.]|nr:N-acetylglucosaminyl-diphospho-decaprenol L-rhamnosyltransferase [Glaciihabitans sp.]
MPCVHYGGLRNMVDLGSSRHARPRDPAVSEGAAMSHDAAMSSLAIVVVNYGSSALLAENLAPLARSTGAIVVVVDNFSTPEERVAVSRLASAEGWTAVLSDSNPGFGAAMNTGVARSIELGATRFLLLNPDATLSADAVDSLMQTITASPMTLVSPTILRPDGSVWFAGADLYLEDGRIRSRARRDSRRTATIMPWLSGCCLAVSKTLWEKVGGFDSDFFLYWEDVDLSRRVVDAGGELLVAEDAVAIHAEGGTQRSGGLQSAATAKSPIYYYYNIRNRLLFAARHLDAPAIESWLRVARPVAWEVLLQGGRRQFLSPIRPLDAARRALRDGRRIARDRLRSEN